MKISIITCTYNSEKTIAHTMRSVLDQKVDCEVEHLIIDGVSKDNTLDIVNKMAPGSIIISEKDNGIYDAFNKGLRSATGEIIGFLHSDDQFADEFALARIMKVFEKTDISFYCATIKCYDPSNGDIVDVFGSLPHKESFLELLQRSNNYAHPTFYCKREALFQVGFYDEQYRIAADFDWIMRLQRKYLIGHFDNQPLVQMSAGGVSELRQLLSLKEEWQIKKKYSKISLSLIVIYAYHFGRRTTKKIMLEKGLKKYYVSIRRYYQMLRNKSAYTKI